MHAPRLPTSRARSRSLNGWCECEASTRVRPNGCSRRWRWCLSRKSVAFSAGLRRGCGLNFAHALRRDGGFEEILVEALAGSADEASIESVSWEGQQYPARHRSNGAATAAQSRRARSRACDRSRCDASRARTTARHRYSRIERDSIHSRRIESAGSVVVRFQTSAGVTPEPRRCGRRGRAACAQLRSQSEPRSWNPAGSGSRCRSSRLRLRNDERRCPCARGMGDAETNRQAQCAVAHRGRGPWARRRRPVSRAPPNRRRTATAVTSVGWHRERDVRDERGADGSASDAK